MFGSVVMSTLTCPRAEPGGSGGDKPTTSGGEIKALCRLELPYPESFEKRAERQRFPGMGHSLTG